MGGGGGSSGPKGITTRISGDRDTIKTTGTITRSTKERPVGCAFHNGRVFYAGVNLEGQATIYFSQLLTNTEKAGRCYQDADPTAAEINDLVATDGGLLNPVGMGYPVAIKDTAFGLLVFATNGVWQIAGSGDGVGFSATSFKVGKVSDDGALGPQSIIEVEGAIVYFGEEAIFQLAPDQFGNVQSQDLSSQTIKKVYRAFSRDSRARAKGTYSDNEKRAYWVIPNLATTSGELQHDSSFVLVLAAELPGFFLYTVQMDALGARPRLLVPFEQPNAGVVTDFVPIVRTDGRRALYKSTGELIGADKKRRVAGIASVSFMTVRRDNSAEENYVEFASLSNENFYDWSLLDVGGEGYDYTSFVEFAYTYATSRSAGLQSPYVHSYFLTERPQFRVYDAEPYGGLPLITFVTFSAGLRITQEAKETLMNAVPAMRVTQQSNEVLLNSVPAMRVTQEVKEVLYKV